MAQGKSGNRRIIRGKSGKSEGKSGNDPGEIREIEREIGKSGKVTHPGKSGKSGNDPGKSGKSGVT